MESADVRIPGGSMACGFALLILVGAAVWAPRLALAQREVLSDAQLEAVAALPANPDPSGQAGPPEPDQPPVAFTAAQRSVQRRPVQTFVIPYSYSALRPDGSLDSMLGASTGTLATGVNTSINHQNR